MGLTEIPGREGDGAVTVYYPSSSDAQTIKQGPFTFQLLTKKGRTFPGVDIDDRDALYERMGERG